jgi:hypothetical protein
MATDHDTLDRLRQVHPAWRILIADPAPLVLSFLTLAFIQPNRRAIPAPEIAARGAGQRSSPYSRSRLKVWCATFNQAEMAMLRSGASRRAMVFMPSSCDRRCESFARFDSIRGTRTELGPVADGRGRRL